MSLFKHPMLPIGALIVLAVPTIAAFLHDPRSNATGAAIDADASMGEKINTVIPVETTDSRISDIIHVTEHSPKHHPNVTCFVFRHNFPGGEKAMTSDCVTGTGSVSHERQQPHTQ